MGSRVEGSSFSLEEGRHTGMDKRVNGSQGRGMVRRREISIKSLDIMLLST